MTHIRLSYEERLSNKIRNLLGPVFPEGDIEEVLTPPALEQWKRAFRHRVVSSESSPSYEVHEAIGDKLISYIFMRWLKNSFPSEQRSQIYSDMNSYYTSKPIFLKFAERWNLIPFMLELLPEGYVVTEKEKSDLFESFIGVAAEVIDEFYGEGLSYLILYKLVFPLYEEMHLDPAKKDDYVSKISLLKDYYDVRYGIDEKYYLKTKMGSKPPNPIYVQSTEDVMDPLTNRMKKMFKFSVYNPRTVQPDPKGSTGDRGALIVEGTLQRSIPLAKEDAAAKAVAHLNVTWDEFERIKKKNLDDLFEDTYLALKKQGIDGKFEVFSEGEEGNVLYTLYFKIRDSPESPYKIVGVEPNVRPSALRNAVKRLRNVQLAAGEKSSKLAASAIAVKKQKELEEQKRPTKGITTTKRAKPEARIVVHEDLEGFTLDVQAPDKPKIVELSKRLARKKVRNDFVFQLADLPEIKLTFDIRRSPADAKLVSKASPTSQSPSSTSFTLEVDPADAKKVIVLGKRLNRQKAAAGPIVFQLEDLPMIELLFVITNKEILKPKPQFKSSVKESDKMPIKRFQPKPTKASPPASSSSSSSGSSSPSSGASPSSAGTKASSTAPAPTVPAALAELATGTKPSKKQIREGEVARIRAALQQQ